MGSVDMILQNKTAFKAPKTHLGQALVVFLLGPVDVGLVRPVFLARQRGSHFLCIDLFGKREREHKLL